MNKRAMLVSALCVAGLAAIGGGCQANKDQKCCDGSSLSASVLPVNTVCPIGGHSAEKMVPVAYKGKTIGFCCNDCAESFKEMKDAEKDKVLAKAEAQGAAAPKKAS